jgi:hypothetical protein
MRFGVIKQILTFTVITQVTYIIAYSTETDSM